MLMICGDPPRQLPPGVEAVEDGEQIIIRGVRGMHFHLLYAAWGDRFLEADLQQNAEGMEIIDEANLPPSPQNLYYLKLKGNPVCGFAFMIV